MVVRYLRDGEEFGASHFAELGNFTRSATPSPGRPAGGASVPNTNQAQARSMPTGARSQPQEPLITGGKSAGYAVDQRDPMATGGRVKRAGGGSIPGQAPAASMQPMTRTPTGPPSGGNPLSRAQVTMPASDLAGLATGAAKAGARVGALAQASRSAGRGPHANPGAGIESSPAAASPPPVSASPIGVRKGGRIKRADGGWVDEGGPGSFAAQLNKLSQAEAARTVSPTPSPSAPASSLTPSSASSGASSSSAVPSNRSAVPVGMDGWDNSGQFGTQLNSLSQHSMAKGGRVKRALGGPMVAPQPMMPGQMPGAVPGQMPAVQPTMALPMPGMRTGGRVRRASGGDVDEGYEGSRTALDRLKNQDGEPPTRSADTYRRTQRANGGSIDVDQAADSYRASRPDWSDNLRRTRPANMDADAKMEDTPVPGTRERGSGRGGITPPGGDPGTRELAKGGHFIQGAIKHPGALHRDLGVPQGQPIPAKKLQAAKHSDNPTIARRANLAATLKGMNHKGRH